MDLKVYDNVNVNVNKCKNKTTQMYKNLKLKIVMICTVVPSNNLLLQLIARP
jgi:hypothetical protein